MKPQDEINYNRVADAIAYIRNNFKSQPGLDAIADQVNVSPYHFQRLFTDWAGTSPKKFLQYISIEYAKKLLKDNQASLCETAVETGLSGASRLHDLFIQIEGMTPGEYKNGGQFLAINYCFAETPFGKILIASTAKGVCYIAFTDDEIECLQNLQGLFPNASYQKKFDQIQQDALVIFTRDWSQISQIKLHLKGSVFQLKIWETLLKIPFGQLVSYGTIAKHIEHPSAARAVGSAIGGNPVAFLIPCHRVIQSSGTFGGYMWGSARKSAIIGWEAAKIDQENI